ncbi:hypothetical protein ABIE61_000356 [Marinobacterium sp. MBR-111]|jgi:hypothetical protein
MEHNVLKEQQKYDPDYGRSTRSEAEQQQPVVSGTQFYKQCIDCGKFVPKSMWIPKSHPTYKGAMCLDCLSGYDGPEYH